MSGEQKTANQHTEEQKALQLLGVDKDLRELESRIGKFNIFDALRITHAEIRHSNFLKFMVDPAESHGHGQHFLKALLVDLLKEAQSESSLSRIDLHGIDFHSVEVKREWNGIDLLLICKVPRFAVVIENKVGSQEHSDQLRRYQRTMADQFHRMPVLYVYLTPHGDQPSEDSWLPYTYADLYRVLSGARDLHQKAIAHEVLVFLDHYLDLLRTRYMNDDELDEVCQRIYKKHGLALRLIWDRVSSPESRAFAETASVLKDDGRWHVFYHSRTCLEFVPKTWLGWLPAFGLAEDPRYWIITIFRLQERKIEHQLQVYELTNAAKRKKIVTKLRKEVPRFGFKAATRSGFGRIARVSVRQMILEWREGEELESKAIRLHVKKALADLYPKLQKLAVVLKPLCKIPTSAP
jgi:hypothetical protein